MDKYIISHITQLPEALQIDWQDGYRSLFHYVWLRDNDARMQNSIGQQSNNILHIPLDIKPTHITLNETLNITWSENSDVSCIDPTWLRENAYEPDKAHKHRPPLHPWKVADFSHHIEFFHYPDLSDDEGIMRSMLQHLRDFGFSILKDVPPKPGMVLKVLELFGYPFETHHNKMWEIKVIPTSEDIGDTDQTLPAHIDQPYRCSSPTITMLHFLSNSLEGGDSTLVDGFRLAEDLRHQDPDKFELLTTIPVEYRYHDDKTDLQCEGTIIELNARKEVIGIRMNPFSIQPFHVAPEKMMNFYAAYQKFVQMTEDTTYKLTLKLETGNLLLIDNIRMLHGRHAYENNSGERILQGCFSKQDDFWSKLRVLNRRFNVNPS